ncbi:MAG: GAF domain-containing protein [Bacteroidia bacterium]
MGEIQNTFGIDIIPKNEKERIAALKRYDDLDAASVNTLNKIAGLTAKIFNMPIALVAFADETEVLFKGNVGMEDVPTINRGISLCALAVLNNEPTIFDRPMEEPCLLANPLVAGDFGLKFYAGAPLQTHDGFNIGTVCVVDKKQRYLNDQQINILQDIASITMDFLELKTKGKKKNIAAKSQG